MGQFTIDERGRGYHLDYDDDGYPRLTDELLLVELQHVYDTFLANVSRGLTNVSEVANRMSFLDTVFHLSPLRDTMFSYRWLAYHRVRTGEPVYRVDTYSGEEVNYMGVGLGFAHFRLFFVPGSQIIVSHWWNYTKYKHFASGGEVRWASYGRTRYSSLNRQD